MKVSTLIIFLAVLYKYTQLFMGENINIVSISIIGIIIINVILTIKNKKITNAKTFIILSLISIAITIIAKDPNFILPFLLAILLQDEEPNKIIKKFLYSYIIMFAITIILAQIGIVDKGVYHGYDSSGNNVTRISLGFGYPNTTFIFLFGILVCYYLKKGKLNIINMIIMTIVVLIFYYYTKCRTGLLVSIFFIYTINIMKKISKRKVIKFMLENFFIILTIVSIIIAIKFGTSVNPVNTILSNRPILWNINLANGYSLFGKNLNAILDNFMLMLLMQQGVIIFSIYAILFYKAIKKYFEKEENVKYGLAICYTLIYGITEAALNISNNIFLLLIFLIYFNKYIQGKEIKDNEKNISSKQQTIIL